jgi:nucleotide-binding universal stress UspA family protein
MPQTPHVETHFSPASRPAFAKAVSLARAARAPLLLVHVLAPPALIMDGYVPPQTLDAIVAGQRAAGRRQLARLVARARSAGVRASAMLIDVGMPAEQSRTGLNAAVLGSVARRVVSTARCPVMTVHGR